MEPADNHTAVESGADAEIERLKQDLEREHDMYMRALADFENYRRRSERDSAHAVQSGKRDLLLSLLEVLDGFERGLRHAEDSPEAMAEGIRALHRKLLRTVEAQGVTPFDSVGEAFDPNLHEAAGAVRTDQYKPGVVAEELERGYRLGNAVLRPARVRVAQ